MVYALHSQRAQTRGDIAMSKKPAVRKATKKISDQRRVRFGGGSLPRVLRTLDKATQDSRAIRFGAGSMVASLKKQTRRQESNTSIAPRRDALLSSTRHSL